MAQAPQKMHPLDGPRAKLTRAAQQAKRLMAQCEGFQASQPVEFETVWDGDATSYTSAGGSRHSTWGLITIGPPFFASDPC
jgi:hypothetical protein